MIPSQEKQKILNTSTWISTTRINIKLTLKLILGAASWPLLAWNKSKGMRVIYYHRVNPYPFQQLGPVSREITITPTAFEKQLTWLKTAGYRSANPHELKAVLNGTQVADPKSVVITFDDGFEDNYLWAHKILLKHGFQGIFFITTDYVGADQGPEWTVGDAPDCGRFLRWEQLRQMQNEGAIIASHTCSHRILTTLNDQDLTHELMTSRAVLAEKIGIDTPWFAYPAGDEDARTRTAVEIAGYNIAFTTVPGTTDSATNRMAVPRSEVSASDSLWVFRMKMSGLLDWTRFKESSAFRNSMRQINQVFIRKIVGA